ncbi:spore germination protein KA [Caldanaerobius fijiensis DSM 17918]|uniref:Spore germination protein KA n=1 Tax=Caldanaerobius fijiensis DSM 17918 TaxID=1121256 RepID=A0A1M4ZEZ6_9THEO|nr:spore germination protein [Caldanaerobius fijiensis]SHF16580.1 spore germination protein KA [Caldanaerobius fijiensis DSM 17918]
MPKKTIKPISVKDFISKKAGDTANDNIAQYLSKNLKVNIEYLKNLFNSDTDIVFRYFTLGDKKIDAAVILIDGFVDKKSIQKNILIPLMSADCHGEDIFKAIQNHLVSMENIKEENEIEKLEEALLNGNVILLIDGYDTAIVISAQQWDMRGIEEPITEAVVRGPREGLNENLKTNITLIRRRLRTSKLRIESFKIGRVSKTNVAIVYLENIATDDLVNEVKNRLKRIEIDGILESSYIEELITDAPYSPFPTIEHTERPDKVAACLLEGRVAILTDNTPFALMVPATFFQFLQASEDYYGSYVISTPIRWIRFLALFISLFLPSIYIAATTFHPEMIPTQLAVAIAAQREGVPFPAMVEALLMEISFELLREAGIRLPKTVGQTISIVGALVIGNAAVSAGIVSPAMVIIVAFTGIASFMIPSYAFEFTFRLLRFPLMVVASMFGFYGIILVAMAILLHLTSLRSFGVPYMSPLAPTDIGDIKDTLVRAPRWAMKRRPTHIGKKNEKREADNIKPQADKSGDKQ